MKSILAFFFLAGMFGCSNSASDSGYKDSTSTTTTVDTPDTIDAHTPTTTVSTDNPLPNYNIDSSKKTTETDSSARGKIQYQITGVGILNNTDRTLRFKLSSQLESLGSGRAKDYPIDGESAFLQFEGERKKWQLERYGRYSLVRDVQSRLQVVDVDKR